MADTQWPQYIVFHQASADRPHDYAGAVHAPDPELALTNARDVFVRRPDCVSLWVVREDHIFARTAEELAADPGWARNVKDSGLKETWLVFQKLQQRGTHIHVGEVQAGTAESALKAALKAFANHSALVWWVLSASAVTRSRPEDIEQMFEIARRKTFRNQDEFRTVTAMRQIVEGKKE